MSLSMMARSRAWLLATVIATAVGFVAVQVVDVDVAWAKTKKKKVATKKAPPKKDKKDKEEAPPCKIDDDCKGDMQCVEGKCIYLDKDGKPAEPPVPDEEDAEKAAKEAAEKEAKAKEDKTAASKPAKDTFRTSGPAKLHMPMESKDFDRSLQADKKRDAVIEDLKKVLNTMQGPQKAEVVFRLAENYWEKSKFIESIEYAEFEKDVQKWVEGGMKGSEPKPEPYYKKSVAYKKQALNNYQLILDQYKDYPRRDEVLYIMAYNQYEAGKKAEAVRNYWELIKQYPQSQFVGDAYLAMGEHYFNSNQVLKARKAFLKALETKKPKIYSFALYKLAWCDYNLQEFDAAIDKFKKVVDYAERQEKKTSGEDRDHVQLKNEALNDLTLTFSHIDAVDTAYDYLRKKGGEKLAKSLIEKLARIYSEQGKFDQEIQTYRLVINTYPDDPSAPDFQSSIVAAFSKLGKRDEVRTEVRRLVELYRPGSPWWKRNEANKSALSRARDTAEARMRELVTDYHQYCQKFKKRPDCTLSMDIYAEYLKAFPDSEHAYRMRFFYAEILWDLGYYRMAGEQYDKVVDIDPKGEYARNAAFASVLTWEKIVAGIEKDEAKKIDGVDETKEKKRDPTREQKITFEKNYKEAAKKGKSFEEKPIPENELKLAAACDRYVLIVPTTVKDKEVLEELVSVKFKAGAIYQKYYHFTAAAQRFGELIDRWPSHKLARNGADLILDSFDAREDWTELNKWSRKFAKNKSMMADAAFAKAIDKYVEGSSFKEIMGLYDKANKLLEQKKGDEAQPIFADAATRFRGFQAEFPQSQFAPTALFNATVIYDRAKTLDQAIESAELLLKKYDKELDVEANKKNELKEKTLLYLASFYEGIADFEQAAKWYEAFVGKYKNHEKAPDALYNAGILYLGLGDTKKAVKVFGDYIKDYKDAKDVPQVYWKIANVYVDESDWRRASTLFGEFEKRFPKTTLELQFESRFRYAENLWRDNRGKEASKVCEDLVKRFDRMPDSAKKNPVVQEGAGRCAFELLEPDWQSFENFKISKANLKKDLPKKVETAPQLAKKYVDILKYGNGEWGVAGLVRGALAFRSLTEAILTSPDPNLTPDQIEIYRAELENEAMKYEDQAIAGLETALKKAFELGIYSEWTMKGEEALKKYKPNEFPDVKEMPLYPSEAVHTAKAGQ